MNVIEREFDAVARDYEGNRLAPWYKAHNDEILAQCPSHVDGPVLDVGCGTGYFLRRLLTRQPGLQGVGLDISGKMLEESRRLAALEPVPTAGFVKGDWENLDKGEPAPGRFGLVVCASAFHYFSDPAAAARRFFDVLSPQGTLLVMERNGAGSSLTRIWGWLHRHVIRDHVEFHRSDELESYFWRAGFADVKTVRTIRRLLWKNKLYTDIVLIKCSKK